MPIILDTNKDNKLEVKSVTNKQHKQVKATFFHKGLTGSATSATRGHFIKTNDTVKDYIRNLNNSPLYKSTNYQKYGILRSHVESYNIHRQIPFYKGQTSDFNFNYDKHYFKQDILVNAVQPELFAINSSMGIAQPTYIYNMPLVLDTNTYLFDLYGINDWDVIYTEHDIEYLARPFVQTLREYKYNSGTSTSSDTSVFVPVMGVMVITRVKDTNADAKVSLTPHVNKLDKDMMHLHIIMAEENTHGTGVYITPSVFDRYITTHPWSQLTNDEALRDAVTNMLDNTSISDTLRHQAVITYHHGSEIIIDMFEQLLHNSDNYIQALNEHDQKELRNHIETLLAEHIRHSDRLSTLDDFVVTNGHLQRMYSALQTHTKTLKPSNRTYITSQSLRLLLNQRLHELDQLKQADMLYKFEPKDQQVTQDLITSKSYSTQQKQIITETSPLVIGQAGAGSGKSHTLVGRVNYLKDQGEDLSKVLILSFTNIAAINITKRFPDVTSETLATMFNNIYHHNFPLQFLTENRTIANSIERLSPQSSIFKQWSEDTVQNFLISFKSLLKELDRGRYAKMTQQEITSALSVLITDNLDLTITVLNQVKGTSLTLQPLVVHTMLLLENQMLNIPNEYQDINYIITDESQDISTFEYILLLELIIHYNAQLLIIGDGSQTIYEWRNSDPRYLNTLEASGVFETHKLDINFRSNQEVLTYANQFLQVIEANDQAEIQLNSHSFRKPTENSFKEHVKVLDKGYSGSRNATENYNELLYNIPTEDEDFIEWFTQKMVRGEQVAILGYTRRELKAISEGIENLLTINGLDIPITNIMSKPHYPETIMSDIVGNYFNEISTDYDPASPSYEGDIRDYFLDLMSNVLRKNHQYTFAPENMINKGLDQIFNDTRWSVLKSSYQKGQITKSQIENFLFDELIAYETSKNKVDAYLNTAKELPDYTNSQIIVSTIHGTKGLEFQNTVVLFNENRQGATKQDSLRMFFVALSRAQESELIINAYNGDPTKVTRAFSTDITGMYRHPMQTARLRALEDIKTTNSNDI